jgi:hypothetical protein
MSEPEKKPAYTLGDDDKIVPLMVYTDHYMVWGDAILKKMVRVGVWLRTQAAPDTIWLQNAKMVLIASGFSPKPVPYAHVHIKTQEILAYHILPPQADTPDYDVNDKNQRMVPIIGMVSSVRLEGNLWMSIHVDLNRYLEISRDNFIPLYNVKISNPILPMLGTIQVSQVLIKRLAATFALSAV